MARPTLDDPPAAVSKVRGVVAQPLVVGVLGSYGGSASHSALMPGWFQLPGQVSEMMHTLGLV